MNYIILLLSVFIMSSCSNSVKKNKNKNENEIEDESDVVKTSPPNESELQPGRVLSDENIYINEDGTGNFRTHCEESHINNDDPLVSPGQIRAAHQRHGSTLV